jgi:hypothetical protein
MSPMRDSVPTPAILVIRRLRGWRDLLFEK